MAQKMGEKRMACDKDCETDLNPQHCEYMACTPASPTSEGQLYCRKVTRHKLIN